MIFNKVRQIRQIPVVSSNLNRRYSSSIAPVIGFIGLGQMGGPMALNMLKQQPKESTGNFLVFDVQEKNLNPLTSIGAVAAKSPMEIATNADIVVTMLPSTPNVQSVYQGPNGLLEGARKKKSGHNTIWIDSSTIEPAVEKQIIDEASKESIAMVDAPVSGGVTGAAAGTLTFMVGGSTSDFEKAKPYLSQMGKNIVHCGDASMGQVAKLCNNLALAVEMIGVSEAMALGTKLGMDSKVLAGIMNTSSSQCWSSSAYNPYPGVMEGVPSSKNYDGGFASVLMRKDLGLALDAAKASEASVPLTSAAHQLYNLVVAQGYGQKDFGVILKFLQGK